MSRRGKQTVLTAATLIADINARLDNIEELMAWTIRADQRFRVGSRVEFSPTADRRGLSMGRKDGVRTGKVTKVDGFAIDVLLDGYAKPRGFHNKFFMPSNRRPTRKPKPAKGRRGRDGR